MTHVSRSVLKITRVSWNDACVMERINNDACVMEHINNDAVVMERIRKKSNLINRPIDILCIE